MVDVCYPDGTDWSCQYTPEELAEMRGDPAVLAVMERSEAMAWSTLSALLGYRLSLCPVILRPCSMGCSIPTWYTAVETGANYAGGPEGGTFSPYISNGSWFNGCGCGSKDLCGCTVICQIILPMPVGGIANVSIDGAALDPTAYRVDNGTSLVRTDGECWPACQDMNVGPTEVGSFVVDYYPFLAPNDLLRYAAGVLAAEYFKACNGNKACRLPTGVTNISRNGITMDIPAGLYPNGATGLREVDPIIRIYNPNGLKMPPRVASPDSPRARVQTWGVG